jgi:hypothetical protein
MKFLKPLYAVLAAFLFIAVQSCDAITSACAPAILSGFQEAKIQLSGNSLSGCAAKRGESVSVNGYAKHFDGNLNTEGSMRVWSYFCAFPAWSNTTVSWLRGQQNVSFSLSPCNASSTQTVAAFGSDTTTTRSYVFQFNITVQP